MSSRMRVTKGHTRNRRAHHALVAPRLTECPNCGNFHLRHRVCDQCGYYRGRQVIDMSIKTAAPAAAEEPVVAEETAKEEVSAKA